MTSSDTLAMAEHAKMAESINALRGKVIARMQKTMVVDRCKTRDRLDFCESQLREIKVAWDKHQYNEAAARLERLPAGGAWNRCWRAVRGEDFAAYAIEKAAAQAEFETLRGQLPAVAQMLEMRPREE